MLKYEKEQFLKGNKFILGIDEAGRGPMAGPLVVAGVVIDESFNVEGVNDSKKLSEKKRELLYDEIIEKSLHYEIIFVDPCDIDKYNIYQATKNAMEKIIVLLDDKHNFVLIDAMKVDYDENKHLSIIKGDSKSISIAAASILAKVARDRYMRKLATKYPDYKFDKHKGYQTKEHKQIIAEYGIISGVYRESYKPVQEVLLNKK